MRPRVLRHREPVRPLTITMANVLPSTYGRVSATRTMPLSVLNSPGHMHRYRRFATTLTDGPARLAEICVRLRLHNAGLSPAISCQLAWRTPHRALLLATSQSLCAVDVGALSACNTALATGHTDPVGRTAFAYSTASSHSRIALWLASCGA